MVIEVTGGMKGSKQVFRLGPAYPELEKKPTNVHEISIRGMAKVALSTEASDKPPPEVSNKPTIEKIVVKYGGSAGSGSDAFPIYRHHRNVEICRLEKMERDWKLLKDAEDFQSKRNEKEALDESAAAGKRAKRQRRKEAEQDSKKMRKVAEGINTLPSDGSWLEMMKKMDPKELEEKAKVEAPKLPPGVKAAPTVSVKQMSSAANITFRDIE
mmetsp:Transcript_49386/g.130531  ORF Transcript_49386/g.130531 Transcript_49386/m.130531 type:complete len:213 (+) Transcript_49386:117-755(+)